MMKRIYLFTCFTVLIFINSLNAQVLTIVKGNQRFQAIQVDEKSWHVKMGEEEFLLLPKSTVEFLTKKVEMLENDIERYKKVVEAKESLISAFETYELKADEHIKTQSALIDTAESLYLGYKSLYKDVKQLLGLSSFSLTAGVGWVVPPEDRSRPIGTLGVGFHNWLALYHVGKSYNGVSVLYRLPVGF